VLQKNLEKILTGNGDYQLNSIDFEEDSKKLKELRKAYKEIFNLPESHEKIDKMELKDFELPELKNLLEGIETRYYTNYEAKFAKDLQNNDYFINGVALMKVHADSETGQVYKYLYETHKNLKHLKNYEHEHFGKHIVILCSWMDFRESTTFNMVGGMDWIQLCEYLPILVLKKTPQA
jgi:hypothetical protein